MKDAWAALIRLGATSPPRPLAARQAGWLRACLARNAASRYGLQHDFAGLARLDDPGAAYARRVPLVHPADLASAIAGMAAGQPDVLFTGRPLAFERTSGSTGGGKLIPYSAASLTDFQRAVLPWLARLAREHALSGAAYWAISPATRTPETTPGGLPVGLPDAAYLGDAALPAFAALSAVPPWVGAVPDVATWRRLTLYGLLRRPDLELISVWSPTFFLALLDGLTHPADELDALLASGGTWNGHPLPPDPAARQRLAAWRRGAGWPALWPRLKLVSAWGDAASRPYFQALAERLPGVALEAKGLLATEGVVTVPWPGGDPVLAADSGYYEFLDDAGTIHPAHALTAGATYEVILTNAGGLYRYRLGDRVACTGHQGDLPRLRFLGRAGVQSDLVGEKLDDAFVTACLADLPGFRLLTPEPGPPPRYRLILEPAPGLDPDVLAHRLDTALAANFHYAYARRLGQLAPVAAHPLAGATAAWQRMALDRGARLGDIKPPGLWLGALADLLGARAR